MAISEKLKRHRSGPSTANADKEASKDDIATSKMPSRNESPTYLEQKDDDAGVIDSFPSKDESSTEDEEAEVEYPSGKRLLSVIAAILLNIFLTSLDQTILATAIPKITDEFHGLDKVAWYGSAYFMTYGGFQSSWGKTYRYFPLKATFLISMFIFELGSLICGVAPNAETLIVGRAIGGLGGAGLISGAYVIIAFSVDPKVRPTYTGIMSATYGIAAIAGPLLGGVFSDKVTWRWCFYINLPIGGVSAVLIFFFFHTPAKAKPLQASFLEKINQMDLAGATLVMGILISFILAMEYGGQKYAWGSSVVIGLLVGCVLMTIAFAAWQIYRGESAIVVPRLIKRRPSCVSAAFQFFFASSYFILLYYLPIYFQSVDGVSPIESGVRNLPMIIPVVIASVVGGLILSKTGRAAAVGIFGSALATLCAGLLYTLDIGSSAGKWIGYQIIGGIAWGIAWTVAIVIAQAYAEVKDMSSVTAMNLFFQTVGGALGVSAAQAAFVNRLTSTLRRVAPDIEPTQVIATGAAELRSTFTREQIPGIVQAYMQGVKVTFAIALGTAAVSFLISFALSFRKLPTKFAKASVVVEG